MVVDICRTRWPEKLQARFLHLPCVQKLLDYLASKREEEFQQEMGPNAGPNKKYNDRDQLVTAIPSGNLDNSCAT